VICFSKDVDVRLLCSLVELVLAHNPLCSSAYPNVPRIWSFPELNFCPVSTSDYLLDGPGMRCLPRRKLRAAADNMTGEIMSAAILIITVIVGVCGVGGAVIAVLASRSAPDGFEDQEGFHDDRPAPLFSVRKFPE
jgi:hypothetical protein